MALTPEDVVNKRFQHVKFRDGYDQDEVDDFLDEVVVELRRLYQENDELRQKLSAAEQRVNELSKGNGAAPSAPAAQASEELPRSEDPAATQAFPAAVSYEEQAPAASFGEQAPAAPEEQKSPLVAPQQAAAAPQVSAAVPEQSTKPSSPVLPAVGGNNAAADANSLIALAQRVHDEHIAKGEAQAKQIVGEAETRAKQIVDEAETKRRDTLSSLETEQSNLERSLDQLRNFERQYRTRLKSYLTDQLRELDTQGSLVPETLDASKGYDQNPRHSL